MSATMIASSRAERSTSKMSVSVWPVSTITLSFCVNRLGALVQFILVFEPGIEPFEAGVIPKNVRLFLHRDHGRKSGAAR